MPSIFPIAVARRPPKAPAKVVEQKKNEYRFCDSDRLYHLCREDQQIHEVRPKHCDSVHSKQIEAARKHPALKQSCVE